MPLKTYLPWLVENSPLSQTLLGRLPSLSGVRIAASTHLDPKMVPFFQGLLSKGADLIILSCNPSTVRGEVVEILREYGATVFAEAAMTQKRYSDFIDSALDLKPDFLFEIGADLSERLHATDRPSSVRGSLEATGSGLIKLKKFKPRYPIFDWDTVPLKIETHNRVMVGLTACHTFFLRTGLTFHRKRVHVVGYGAVGEGVCRAAAAYGGKVSMSDPDAKAQDRAREHGVEALSLEDAVKSADVVITATGSRNVLSQKHFALAKDGQFLMNVGHLSEEIDLKTLRQYRSEAVLPFVERVYLGKKRLYLFAGGHMANLTAGFGDSLNAFDVILGIMTVGIEFLVKSSTEYPPGVQQLPRIAWEKVLQAEPLISAPVDQM